MRKFKIALDAIMLLLTLTLYSKRFFGIHYHEIAGLVLLALVIVHIAINIKTITAMCKKFMKVPTEIKVGVVVDVLLLLCYLWIGISGVLISHTILTGISSGNIIFKLGHMFGGALSVILLGVHIGLHICRKPLPVTAAAIATAVVLCGGVYGAVKSDEVRWLGIPFTVSSVSNANRTPVGSEHNEPRGNSEGAGRDQGQGERRGNGEGLGRGQGQGLGQGPRNGQGPQGKGKGGGQGRGMSELTVGQKAENVGMFLGMILSVSMITYWIAVLTKKKKNV